MKTAFKLFSDPEQAQAALAALKEAGFGPDAVGVIVRQGGPAAAERVPVGTLPDVGPVAASNPAVFGLEANADGADASAALGQALGLSTEAIATFGVSLLRDCVLVGVRGEDEPLVQARKLLRQADPANLRLGKQRNEAFELADRTTSTNANDGQFSGDFRKY
ncbi:MAG: hypothetical protein ACYC4L_16645 [Chloroflexota bacterium]